MTAVLVVVLVAELAVRLVSSRLPSPLEWSSEEAQVKVEDMKEKLSTAGSVVFVGSSMMDAGVDPTLVSAQLNDRRLTYNAALLGAPMKMISEWTTKVVVPIAHPSVVVVGVSCREVNGAESEQAAINDQFDAAPAMRRRLGTETTLDRMTRQASRVSYLIRFRSVLRQPRNLWGRDRRVGPLLRLDVTGMNRAFAGVRYPPPGRVTEVLFPGAITRFRLGEEEVHWLQRLLRSLHAQEIKSVVVNMPVTEDFVSWMPRGQDDHEDCVNAMKRTTEQAGSVYVDAGIWHRRYFADPIHVNEDGARMVSSLVAAAANGL